jgi:hypothetical protein
MPIERRQIMLSEAEVLHAVQIYRRVCPEFLPHGEVTGLTLVPKSDGGGVQLTIDFSMIYGKTRQTISIQAVETDVVDLLIRCCLENNIPIPRAGRKSATVMNGMLALIICSDDDTAELPAPKVE